MKIQLTTPIVARPAGVPIDLTHVIGLGVNHDEARQSCRFEWMTARVSDGEVYPFAPDNYTARDYTDNTDPENPVEHTDYTDWLTALAASPAGEDPSTCRWEYLQSKVPALAGDIVE